MNVKPIVILSGCLLFAAHVSAQKTETRPVGDFKSISISGGFDKVTIAEGPKTQVKITASGVELDRIETEIDGNDLEIGMKNGNYHNCKISIEVTFKKLEEVNSSGSADIELVKVRGEKFEFNGSGSGDLTGDFEVKKLEINLSGSSDSKLSGRADQQEINISGSGDVDASRLVGSRAEVAISGSGDVKLNVERVRSSVSGSGHIDNVH